MLPQLELGAVKALSALLNIMQQYGNIMQQPLNALADYEVHVSVYAAGQTCGGGRVKEGQAGRVPAASGGVT